ncbi:MAG: mammalian cell entry protein [Burkholderiales bacterium]|nr:mammalian cell entry protein [Burkholderiales bacterium]
MSSPSGSPPPLPPPVGQPMPPASGTGSVASENMASLEFKARLLLLFMLLLVCGSALYVLYARGAFESTRRLVLTAEDSEGVVVGMDMTFAGFPIGRVRRIELAEDGKARILVDVAEKDAHWLRTSSVFTLVKGIVGGPNIRAYTGLLNDPPLPDGAERSVLQGDASAEIPRVISAAKELIDNLNSLTGRSGSVGASLANLQVLTGRLNGPGGALTVLLGSEAEAKKFSATLDHTNSLLAKLDSMAAKTDTQVFGDKGVLPETRATVVQLNAMLGEARTSLKKVDAILVDAQAITSNAKDATSDLGALRGEVEASLRKVEGLVSEINRKWPFARDAEMKLP